MNAALRIVVIGALAALLCGCAAPPGAMPVADRIIDDAYTGKWSAPSGSTVTISRGRGDSYQFDVVRPNEQPRSYSGYLLKIDGTEFAEVLMYRPGEEARGEEGGPIPVLVYSKVEHAGDQLVHYPLKSSWLHEQLKNRSGAAIKDTPQLGKDVACLVVRDAAMMRNLLKKAAKDPAALDKREPLTRIQ